jgi:hypothetical protein
VLNGDKEFRQNMKDGEEFFRAAARGWLDDSEITVVSGTGRNYRDGFKVSFRKNTKADVIVHEFAHVLESNNAVLKHAVDFLNARTAGKPIQRLRDLNQAYDASEIYRDGGFFDAYVGKIYNSLPGTANYKGVRATEVISMGLEKMYTDPIGFYKADKEYFTFIYTLFFAR